MEYIKIEDSGQRSFGQKKNHTIIFVTGGMGYLRQENEKAVCTMEDLIFIKPDNKVKIEYQKQISVRTICALCGNRVIAELIR